MILRMPHGTLNKMKNGALREAFAKLDMDVEVMPYAVASGVDDQPFGGAMGDLGAENRAAGALELCTDPTVRYGIGSESYLEFRRGLWLDFASIAIVERTAVGARPTLVGIASSVGIPCPQEYVLKALAKGAGRKTAGECFAETVPGVDKADWHRTVTKGRFSRRYLLIDACLAAISQVW